MLDVIYLVLILALFALAGLVAKGVERRAHAPRAPPSAGDGWRGAGMIGFEILAAALAVAAIVYLVFALLNPERF